MAIELPGEGTTRKEPKVEFRTASDFALPPTKDNVIAGSSYSSLTTPGIYILEWGLTRESFLMRHPIPYEWVRHAFPPSTIEALELLHNSHMFNNLQYVAAQVTPYLVSATWRLCQVNSDLVENPNPR